VSHWVWNCWVCKRWFSNDYSCFCAWVECGRAEIRSFHWCGSV